MTIVEKIKKLCNKKKLTIAELEKIIGIGNGVIRRWDERTPASDLVIKVAEYFDCTTDYLLGITDRPDRIKPADFDEADLKYATVVKEARALNIPAESLKEFIETIKKLK